MNKTQKILLYATFVIFVVTSILYYSFRQRSVSETQPRITPTISSIRLPEQRKPDSQTTSAEINIRYRQSYQRLNEDQKTRMDRFISTLPYKSSSVDIAYETDLQTVIIALKNLSAEDDLTEILRRSNVLDIYVSGSSVFIAGHNSIEKITSTLKDTKTYGD